MAPPTPKFGPQETLLVDVLKDVNALLYLNSEEFAPQKQDVGEALGLMDVA